MWRIIFYLTASLLMGEAALAKNVVVAVASNFTAPTKALARDFEKQSGHKAKLVFGSSGRIFAQIRHGAPFDVFLSADQAKPAALEANGMAVPNSRFTYAIGTMVLWSSRPHFIKNNADVLRAGNFKRLALANPKLAPYGMAAQQVLQSLGLKEILSEKFVQGENISQTYQFIATGNAALGFIAQSQVLPNHGGSSWKIPDSLHHPIRQDAIILKSAMNNPAALAFAQYLQSDAAKNIIDRHGYKLPTGDE